MHHSMRTVTFKLFAYLKMLVIAGPCFTSDDCYAQNIQTQYWLWKHGYTL